MEFLSYSNHKIPLTSVSEFYYIDTDLFAMLRNVSDIYDKESLILGHLKFCTKDSAVQTLQSQNPNYIIFVAGRHNGVDIYLPLKKIL